MLRKKNILRFEMLNESKNFKMDSKIKTQTLNRNYKKYTVFDFHYLE